MAVRLQKAIADAGICSRRKAELLIESGRVFLNDKKARLGDKAEAGDKIFIDGKEIKLIPTCLLYTSPSPRDRLKSRMPSSA